jgi:hypothetical protein
VVEVCVQNNGTKGRLFILVAARRCKQRRRASELTRCRRRWKRGWILGVAWLARIGDAGELGGSGLWLIVGTTKAGKVLEVGRSYHGGSRRWRCNEPDKNETCGWWFLLKSLGFRQFTLSVHAFPLTLQLEFIVLFI